MFDNLSLEDATPPKRHYLFRAGAVAFYWIWINVGSPHQMRCWILSWNTRQNCIHLSHWKWWRPIIEFPTALRASWRVMKP